MESPSNPYRTGIIIGVLLMLSPIFGLIGTVYGMVRSFGALQDSGITDPQILAHSVSLTLNSMVIGLVLCPIGITILIVSLVLRSRARRTISPPPIPS